MKDRSIVIMKCITISRELLTDELHEISRLLLSLGITANLRGFWPCAYAVLLVIQDPNRLTHVTKWLYPDVAAAFDSSDKAIERSIRTIIRSVWQTNPALLRELAGHDLANKPSASKFISILALHFMSKIVEEHTPDPVKIPAGPSTLFHDVA